MLEKILDYERDVFFLINGSDSVFFDRFMWLYSGKLVWLPLAAFILFMLVYKKKWKESLLIILGIVLVITLCDQFTSHLCKPLFTRFRPTHHPEFMNEVKTVFDYRGGLYGFMSSHAANAFGFATFLALLIRNKLFTITIFIWAALMAYTRIYLGVHFISDIVPGALVGMVFGVFVHKLHLLGRKYTLHKRVEETSDKVNLLYTCNHRLMVAGIFFNIMVIMVFNAQLVTVLR